MFRRKFTAAPAPDRPLYVVGDIHGRADLLNAMCLLLVAEKTPDTQIIFVGDYVDRGPDSAKVLADLIAFKAAHPETVFLRGNHEDMLLDFLAERKLTEIWMRTGGSDTLHSFGIPNITSASSDDDYAQAAAAFREALTGPVLDFLLATQLSTQSGNVFVAHSGADPELALDQQTDRTLMWGRSTFRKAIRRDGIWVAHGHWADTEPSAQDGRIATDTGAYYSNILTAAHITSGDISFLSVTD